MRPVEANDQVILNGRNGPVALNTEQLSSYFSILEQHDFEGVPTSSISETLWSSEKATQFVNRYGLQSPDDVMAYIKSPYGKRVIAFLEAQIAELAEMRTRINLQKLLDDRAALYHLLSSLREDALRDDAIMRHNISELEHAMAEAQQKSKESEKNYAKLLELEQSILTVERLISAFEEEIAIKQVEEEEYKKEHERLEDEKRLAHEHIDEFNHYLDAIAEQIEIYTDTGHTDHHASRQNPFDELKTLEIRKQELLNSIQQYDQKNLKYYTKWLKAKLALDRISLHIDLLNIHKDPSKLMFDEEGRQTKSLRKCYFVVPSGQKIVKYNHTYYLLEAHQDFHKLNTEELFQAHRKFNNNKLSLLHTKVLVKENYNLKIKQIEHKQASITATQTRNTENILEMTQQLQKANEFKAFMRSQMQALREAKQQQDNSIGQQQPQESKKPIPIPVAISKNGLSPAIRKKVLEEANRMSAQNIYELTQRKRRESTLLANPVTGLHHLGLFKEARNHELNNSSTPKLNQRWNPFPIVPRHD